MPPFAVMQRVVELPEPIGRTGDGYFLPVPQDLQDFTRSVRLNVTAGPSEAATVRRDAFARDSGIHERSFSLDVLLPPGRTGIRGGFRRRERPLRRMACVLPATPLS